MLQGGRFEKKFYFFALYIIIDYENVTKLSAAETQRAPNQKLVTLSFEINPSKLNLSSNIYYHSINVEIFPEQSLVSL